MQLSLAICLTVLWTIAIASSKQYQQGNTKKWDAYNNAFEYDLCKTVFCDKGEECLVTDGVARCECASWLQNEAEPVCGSDSHTYPSLCHLERQVCLNRNEKIQLIHEGPCADSALDKKEPLDEEEDEDEDDEDDSKENSGEDLELPKLKEKNSEKLMNEIKWPKIVTLEESLEGDSTNLTRDKLEYTVETSPSLPQTTVQTTTDEPEQKKCDGSDYLFLLNNLLLYFHAKYGEDREGTLEYGKQHYVQRMFEMFDKDSDLSVSQAELKTVEEIGPQYENLLPVGCHLLSLLEKGDLDANRLLSKLEFFKLFGVSAPVTKEVELQRVHRVQLGQQYQILCTLSVGSSIGKKLVWLRHGRPLAHAPAYDFQISNDGVSLYLTPASLVHSGNFSCRIDGEVPTKEQIHMVTVLAKPVVTVSPPFLFLERGEAGRLICEYLGPHAMDPPRIHWEKNLRTLPRNATVLELSATEDSQTGSYSCVVTDSLGTHRASANVIVRQKFYQPERSLKTNQEGNPKFAVLYKDGIRVYESRDCVLSKVIPATYLSAKLGDKTSLCDKQKCEWTASVVVQETIFAALGREKSIAVIDLKEGSLKQMLALNHQPKRLRYVPEEDSVWIESWRDETENAVIIQVIRSASKNIQFSLTHALPQGDTFDIVSGVFLPRSDSKSPSKFGYVSRASEMALHKVDLHSLRVVSRIDLTSHNCIPVHVAFLTSVGLIAAYCEHPEHHNPNGQMLIDYVSDVILSVDTTVHGSPLVTPDELQLVSIDHLSGRIFLQRLNGRQLKLYMTVDEYLPFDYWTLFPSIETFGYDLYATSPESVALIHVSLIDGRVRHLASMNDMGQSGKISGIENQHLISNLNGSVLVSATSLRSVSVLSLLSPYKIRCTLPDLLDIADLHWT